MRRKRRTHSPEFKAKVALAALQGDLAIAELVKKFDVHANQITDWKKQLLSNASDLFGKIIRTDLGPVSVNRPWEKTCGLDFGRSGFYPFTWAQYRPLWR